VIALIKEHLNPAIVAGVLLLSAASHGQRFTGSYDVRMGLRVARYDNRSR
jgi:hypothetical protein